MASPLSAEVIRSRNVNVQLLIEEREEKKKNNGRELTDLNLISGFSSSLLSSPVRLCPRDFLADIFEKQIAGSQQLILTFYPKGCANIDPA